MLKFALGIALLLLQTGSCWAQSSTDFYEYQPKQDDTPTMSVDLAVGPGGTFSRGAKNPVLLLNASWGYRLEERWRLGFGYDLKMQPWADSRSMGHTLGPDIRINIWDNLYLDFEVGVAILFVKKGVYQQTRTGMGWHVQLGYVWMPHKVVGLNVALTVSQRWFGQLYTDFGMLVGPEIRF